MSSSVRLSKREEIVLTEVYFGILEQRGEANNDDGYPVVELSRQLEYPLDECLVILRKMEKKGVVSLESNAEKVFLTDEGWKQAKIIRNKRHKATIFKKMTSEDYLIAIYELSEGTEDIVSMSELARELGLSNAAVSEYIRTLEDLVIVHERKGVQLTTTGKKIAEQVLETRDTLLRFFVDILGLDIDLAESEAHVLEHNFSPLVVERIKMLNKWLLKEKELKPPIIKNS